MRAVGPPSKEGVGEFAKVCRTKADAQISELRQSDEVTPRAAEQLRYISEIALRLVKALPFDIFSSAVLILRGGES